jgi:hypothetical protein
LTERRHTPVAWLGEVILAVRSTLTRLRAADVAVAATAGVTLLALPPGVVPAPVLALAVLVLLLSDRST